MQRIIVLLDQLINLSIASPDGFEVIKMVTDPKNLSLIFELSVQSSIRNQILIQRVLQKILQLDLPQQIYDEAISKAQHKKGGSENKVAGILTAKTCMQIPESPFLQFLLNRLWTTRCSLYEEDTRQTAGLNSVMQEQLRTIRLIFTDSNKNAELRKALNESIFLAFLDLTSMNPIEIDTLMNFIPETSL